MPVFNAFWVQSAVLTNTWTVFDKYRQSFLMGELLWNFQDFQSYESGSCNVSLAVYITP